MVLGEFVVQRALLRVEIQDDHTISSQSAREAYSESGRPER